MRVNSTQNGNIARLHFLAAFFVFWLLAISSRLVWLQVVRFGDLTLRAARQQQRNVELAPPRGVIYDRNGHELAMTVSVDSVFAVPSEIPDQASVAQVLSKVLNLDAGELLHRMRSSKSFCWVARKLDPADSERVRALNLKGIYFQKESRRFYPNRDLAAQVLGYVGMDDAGLAGLERAFDSRMKGTPGKMLLSIDARQHSLGSAEDQPTPGTSLVLTLDEKIQYIAERELEAAMQRTHAETGTVVVQNPHTGEILALASRPTFDPNTFHVSNLKTLKNHAVSDVYEPGSTFKLVTLSAALEEKLTRPDEMIDCQEGAISVNGVRIRDHASFGMLSVADILAHSSDVGAIKVGLRLGDDRFYRYIREFGFGTRTGIELPGETRGMVKPPPRWSKASIGAISMGQEIAVTPLQIASMVSAIANDGVYTPPRILAGEVPANAPLDSVAFHPADSHRVLSPITAAEMRQMMEGVVLHGTGQAAILNGYTSAGKTGTAQKVDPVTHRYSATKLIASFVGFAPVNDPAVTILVVLDSPVGGHMGGAVAGPVFTQVAEKVLAYLNVPRDAEVMSAQRLKLRAAAQSANSDDSSLDRLGESGELLAMIDQADEPPHKVVKTQLQPRLLPVQESLAEPSPDLPDSTGAGNPTKGSVVVEDTDSVVAPLFIGKSVRAAAETAEQAGLEIKAIGTGIAQQQAPAAGTRVPEGGVVTILFAR